MASRHPHTASDRIPVALEVALIGLVLVAVMVATFAIVAAPAG
jgi:hypothetical protein